jgi:hypothetical protein
MKQSVDAAALAKVMAATDDATWLAEADRRPDRAVRKETTMNSTTGNATLDAVCKVRGGLIAFAKSQLASDDPPLCSEAEATAAVTAHFKLYRPGNPDQAFAKGIATSPEGPVLLSWIQACKVAAWNAAAAKVEGWKDPPHTAAPRFDTKPRQFGGDDTFREVSDTSDAMTVYNEIVAEIRAAHPTLPAVAVYSRAYSDRRHADALAVERGCNRPGGANERSHVSGPYAAPRGSSPGRL